MIFKMFFIHLISTSFTRTSGRPPETLASCSWWRWKGK